MCCSVLGLQHSKSEIRRHKQKYIVSVSFIFNCLVRSKITGFRDPWFGACSNGDLKRIFFCSAKFSVMLMSNKKKNFYLTCGQLTQILSFFFVSQSPKIISFLSFLPTGFYCPPGNSVFVLVHGLGPNLSCVQRNKVI